MPNKKALVLGGDFAGLTAALSVKRELGTDVDVTVVAKSDRFLFNPSLNWIPFGRRNARDVVFPVARTVEWHGVEFVHAEATRIDPPAQKVERHHQIVVAVHASGAWPTRCSRRANAA